jgi:hypothetical protein
MNVNLADIGATPDGAHAVLQHQRQYFNTNITKSFEWRIEH